MCSAFFNSLLLISPIHHSLLLLWNTSVFTCTVFQLGSHSLTPQVTIRMFTTALCTLLKNLENTQCFTMGDWVSHLWDMIRKNMYWLIHDILLSGNKVYITVQCVFEQYANISMSSYFCIYVSIIYLPSLCISLRYTQMFNSYFPGWQYRQLMCSYLPYIIFFPRFLQLE